MPTLSEMSIKPDKEIRRHMFENMIESFSKQYRPNDPIDSYHFDAALMSIVRMVYEDAQAPLLKQLTVMMENISIMSNPLFKTEK